MASAVKKIKEEPVADLFDLPLGGSMRSKEESEKAFRDAVKTHPFYDNAHSILDIYKSGVVRDGKGNVLGILVRNGLPAFAAKLAADVLRPAATKTSLRCSIFGGEPPNSGIAGYFDYRGSPIEHKYRKTSFTSAYAEIWPDVFPMVNYVSAIYKRALPQNWERQDAAIPDIVRINGSPYSTLTINSRFRTAHHTDAGDFDAGYGCIACMEGDFKGICLTFDEFKVNVTLQPTDVLIFNTHHFHSNTELEALNPKEVWSRLTCVFTTVLCWGARQLRRIPAALEAAKQLPERPPLCVDTIVEKDNGSNLNKADTVYPVDITPFALATIVTCLKHCAAKAVHVQNWLLRGGEDAEVLLFGEPFKVKDGIPERADCDMESHPNMLSMVKTPAMGGFKECDTTIAAAAEKEQHLSDDNLSAAISSELFEMWRSARVLWLELVDKEWKSLVSRNPTRTQFVWNNRSEMNSAFYDLCDVAKQIMLDLLHQETASPKEELAFWALFATHMNRCCTHELHMPEEAVSLRKLNVKLKDYNFGGTRYFKDMPEEEKKRRLERKQKIEDARRRSARMSEHAHRSQWLQNDSFDYQTEDRQVDYAGNGWPLPMQNISRVSLDEVPRTELPVESTDCVRLLVIVPVVRDVVVGECVAADCVEAKRLLENPAALRILTSTRDDVLPAVFKTDDVNIKTVDVMHTIKEKFDFIILQHVLATMDDSAASAYVETARRWADGCVLVEETDLQCRHYFTLLEEKRAAYDEAALPCFQTLHRARYGTENACIRTKAQIEKLCGNDVVCGRFKMVGSPLNTTVTVVQGL
ncbi:DNA J-binding protein [Strigomonas culicis]|uniref:thymine dioxygenase n=1 Tax=Strigomonas culicis TaxID=28005 RepID=S9UGN9_9TRYP|nr:DNA J-binding protein [Strigomonas culicis]|eukprot:EPY28078.1 DNA J-binding protein [Strigomonas culicis]